MIGAFVLVCIVSCENKQAVLQKKAYEFASLECKAIKLREKRFALANEIRFTTDSIRQFSKATDTSQLHRKLELYNKNKETMLQQSLAVAQTIQHELSSLMKNELSDKNDRAYFNALLNKALIEKGHTNGL